MAKEEAVETEQGGKKPRKARVPRTEGQMEIHVIRRLEDWLSKLKPAARARVTAYVVDRARQLDHEEKEAAYREQLQHTGVAQRTSPEFLRGLG